MLMHRKHQALCNSQPVLPHNSSIIQLEILGERRAERIILVDRHRQLLDHHLESRVGTLICRERALKYKKLSLNVDCESYREDVCY